MNNRAVCQSKGDIVVLLNNDIEMQDPNWLSEMVKLALLREVGAVGAKLMYSDGRVQHGGVATGPDGIAAHILNGCSAAGPRLFWTTRINASVVGRHRSVHGYEARSLL